MDQKSSQNSLSYYSGDGSLYPPEYQDPLSHYQNKFKDLSLWISRVLKENEATILDVGSGLGNLGYWMKQINPSIRVIEGDYSFDAVNYGAKINLNSRSVNLSADRLPFASNSLDGLLFGDILEHLSPFQAEQALNEAYRILKLGGHLFINIPNRDTWTRKTFLEPTHKWIPTIADMSSVAKLINLHDIKISTRGFPISKQWRSIFGKDLHLPLYGTSIFICGKK